MNDSSNKIGKNAQSYVTEILVGATISGVIFGPELSVLLTREEFTFFERPAHGPIYLRLPQDGNFGTARSC